MAINHFSILLEEQFSLGVERDAFSHCVFMLLVNLLYRVGD